MDRTERFTYHKGDLKPVDNQCLDCIYNLKLALRCGKYDRIPRGTRNGKIRCPYKNVK